MDEKARLVASILKVLSNENRLMILCCLKENPMTVSEIQRKLDCIGQSAISQHLSLLKAHKIVDSEKKGQSVTYFIGDEKVSSLIDVLMEKYCG